MPNPPKRKPFETWQASLVAVAFVAVPITASRFTWGPHILLGGLIVYVLVAQSIYRWKNKKEG